MSAGESLEHRVLSGVRWSSFARIGQQFISFGVTAVLAHLVQPNEFGMVAMVAVFAGFAAVLAELGLGLALVQRQDVTSAHETAAFWGAMGWAAILALALAVAGQPIARFYSEPRLTNVVYATSLSFLVSSASIVPLARLQRQMAFAKLAIVDFSSAAFGGCVAAGVALAGGGVWALVTQTLATAGGSLIMLWYLAPGWPASPLTRAAGRDLASFSTSLAGFNFLNYWARNADNLLIGRFFSAQALGFYTRAYGLMVLPITQVIGVMNRVMFTALSTMQGDIERFRRNYLRAMGMIAAASFPMMCGLWASADDFVGTVFGSQWKPVVPVLRILCAVGLTQSMCSPTGWIYTAMGRTDRMFRWGVFASTLIIASLILGVVLGSLETTAWAYLAVNVFLTYPCIRYAGSLVKLQFSDVFAEVQRSLVASVAMSALVWFSSSALPTDWGHASRLAAEIGIGIITYVGLLSILDRRRLIEMVDMLTKFRPRSRLPTGTPA